MEKHIWEAGILQKHSPCPSHRWGQATTKILNEMVIFGGYADSLYMNDLWSFNGETMKWTVIQTTGDIPCNRSNATIHYDHIHNNIVLFGGGGQNKLRYNDIHILNWENRQWRKEECVDNGSILWERTYHSSQLLYPYLFVFGGEAVSDLNDLWAYNIETKIWVQIKSIETKTKPCPRRFHSSGLIGNSLYIVAGCHDKYRCLNDVFSIDLTPFIAQSICQLQWKELRFKGSSFLTRWGQSSAVFEDRIYIFGGRFSSDLQDLIVLDPSKQTIKTVKVSGQIPQGRRRHSLTFFGSSLLIFGGFNGQYFNDINFVNVFDINSKKEEIISQVPSRGNWLNNQFLCDYQINTKESEQFFIHIGLIKNKFKESYQMYQFLEDINGIYTKSELLELFQTLYIGIGNISEDLGLRDYNLKLYDTEVQQDSSLKKKLCPCLPQTFSLSMKPKISSKIIHVQQSIYNSFIQELQDQMLHDITIVLNDQYCLPANKIVLASSSKYFQYLFKGQKTAQQINLKIDIKMGDVRIFQAVHIFLQTGYLIVPKQIDYVCWMYLIKQASYFSLSNLQAICMQQLLTHINERNYEELLLFSIQNRYKVLASFCGEFLFKFLNFKTQNKSLKPSLISQKHLSDTIKYYEQMYSFELKQAFLRKRLSQNEKIHFTQNEQNQNNNPIEM